MNPPPTPQSPAEVLDAASTSAYSTSEDRHSPSPNVLIIDLEGFHLRKDFYVKELAFYNPTTMMCWTSLFKPPFDRQFVKKKYATDMEFVNMLSVVLKTFCKDCSMLSRICKYVNPVKISFTSCHY